MSAARDPNRFQQVRVAASRREHGTRARYIAGCRCLPCRAANSRYSCSRDLARKLGDVRDIVSADAAVAHIHKLSRLGVGRRTVADAAGVARSIVSDILQGRRSRIRKNTEVKILSVDAGARAGGSLIPAKNTWELIDELLSRGYTKTQLARWLGYKNAALQFKRSSITLRRAVAVEKLYRGIEAGRYKR